MSNLLLPSYAKNPRGCIEFGKKPDGSYFTGTCTWTGLEAIRAAIENRAPSTEAMAAMAWDALRRGYCTASNGATTLAKVAQYAYDRLGYKNRLILQANYAVTNGNEEIALDWRGAINTHAGRDGILVQVAHGGRLIDLDTGVRDEAAPGLAYHAFAIVGQGLMCVDGDNLQAPRRLQHYALDLRDKNNVPVNSIAAAVPVGMLILRVSSPVVISVPPKPTPKPTPAPKPIPQPKGTPLGWHWDGVTLWPPTPSPIDGKVHGVAHELNAAILSYPGGWPANDIPLEDTQDDNPTRFHQTYTFHQWRAVKNAAGHWQPFLGNIGVDLLKYHNPAPAAKG